MLSHEELESTARLKGLSLAHAERDYLQEVILFSIYSQVGKALVFKGGTCLYKLYKLNRFSEDLDFTLTGKADMAKLANTVLSDLGMLNIRSRIKELKEYRNEINIRFLVNGPLYDGGRESQCFIPLNISKKENVILEPKRESFISLYKELPNFELFAMQEKEILAEKVRAVLTRVKPRDVYDLWFLLARKNVELDVQLVNGKLALYKKQFDPEELMSRIKRMKGLWETDLASLVMGEAPQFESLVAELNERIRGGGGSCHETPQPC